MDTSLRRVKIGYLRVPFVEPNTASSRKMGPFRPLISFIPPRQRHGQPQKRDVHQLQTSFSMNQRRSSPSSIFLSYFIQSLTMHLLVLLLLRKPCGISRIIEEDKLAVYLIGAEGCQKRGPL